MEREAEAQDNRWRTRLDAVLMHRIWGSLIFLCIVYIIFFLSFAIGDPLVRLIQTARRCSASGPAACWNRGPACNPCWGKAWWAA